jgi:hypothetical protein
MINADKFLKRSLIIFLVFFLFFCLLFLVKIVSSELFIPVLISLFISSLNFFIGLYAIKKGLKKHINSLMKIIFGGMVFRLFLTASLILISLKFLDINGNNFIFSVFFFYILFLIIEVYYLNLLKT